MAATYLSIPYNLYFTSYGYIVHIYRNHIDETIRNKYNMIKVDPLYYEHYLLHQYESGKQFAKDLIEEIVAKEYALDSKKYIQAEKDFEKLI